MSINVSAEDERYDRMARLERMEFQIARIVSDIESEKGTRQRANKEVMDKLDNLSNLLTGNGLREANLFTRVDRLERAGRIVGRIVAWLATILAAVVVEIILRAVRQ